MVTCCACVQARRLGRSQEYIDTPQAVLFGLISAALSLFGMLPGHSLDLWGTRPEQQRLYEITTCGPRTAQKIAGEDNKAQERLRDTC
jgi:hypothetical protein